VIDPAMVKSPPPTAGTLVDRPEYLAKKRFFEQLFTIYGRKPVLEALGDPQVPVYRLHLATSNQPSPLLDELLRLAQARGVETHSHSREELSRISRNARQDQGVAADIRPRGLLGLEEFLDHRGSRLFQLLALDRVTNPQNLGMIVRSVCASGMDGLLLARTGNAAITPLVVKASAGTLFRASLVRCDTLSGGLARCRRAGAEVCLLSAQARDNLFDFQPHGSVVFVLGNESEGVSPEVASCCSRPLRIPLHNGVESLNVAVAAALVAFRPGR
jgi:23S rRNA (guanosine2251-2'-O)-methyltransferase